MIGTRTVEYHQGQRSHTAPTGRTYDRSRPKRSERQKPLAKRPSTYDGGSPPPPCPSLGHCDRPENPAHGFENVESAPGIATSPETSELAAHSSGLADASRRVTPRHERGEVPLAASPGDNRPENPTQELEKVQSAPGILVASEAANAASRDVCGVDGNGPTASARDLSFAVPASFGPRPPLARKILRKTLRTLDPDSRMT